MKYTVVAILASLLLQYGNLCHGQIPRLVALSTTETYRDSAGNEFSYTADSIHYGYKTNDAVPVKLLGALDKIGKYGMIEAYEPSCGTPNYGLHDVIPARYDTMVKYTAGKKFRDAYPHWDHITCDPHPYSVTLHEYDGDNKLTSVTLYQQGVSCDFEPELHLFFQKNCSYDKKNNCIGVSEIAYSLTKPQSIFEITAYRFAYNENNNRIYEFDSVSIHGETPVEVSTTQNAYDDRGRIVHQAKIYKRELPSEWRALYTTDYAYSGTKDSESVLVVTLDSNARMSRYFTNRHTYLFNEGKIATVRDESLGRTTDSFKMYSSENLEYDSRGRLIKETNPDKNSGQELEWRYNDSGLPASFTTPQGFSDFMLACPNGNYPVSIIITCRYYYQ